MLVFLGLAERPLYHDGEAPDPGQPQHYLAKGSHHEMRNGMMVSKLRSLGYLEKGGR